MTIDDIYYAAVNGEKRRLIELLENNKVTKQVDINEMIDGGVNNGVHSSFTVLFSVLYQMQQNGFNREIMDVLVEYGIDLNTRVKVSSDAFVRQIPLMVYFIREWNQPEMLKYFLEKGANPDIAQNESYVGSHTESYPATYFAIMFNESLQMLNLLLEYGADPNRWVFAYNYEEAVSQRLPLMFYALVKMQNKEKCIALFNYGAYLDTETITGDKWNNKWKFNKYISGVYPQYTRMLDDAYLQGCRNPKKGNNLFIKNQLLEELKGDTGKKEDITSNTEPVKKKRFRLF